MMMISVKERNIMKNTPNSTICKTDPWRKKNYRKYTNIRVVGLKVSGGK